MSVDFFTTTVKRPHQVTFDNHQMHSLRLGLSYVAFDDLRNQIEAVLTAGKPLDLNVHPGLKHYLNAFDNGDWLSNSECIDLYGLLRSERFADLEQNDEYQVLLQALRQAIIKQEHLFWV